MPAFVRQLVKETEKRVTSFFKGGRGGGAGELSEGEEAGEEEGVIPSPYLDRPVLDKHMQEGCASWGLTYALASMQGWRAHMEDFHNCFPQLGGNCPIGGSSPCSMDTQGARWPNTAPGTCWTTSWAQVSDKLF